MKNPEYLCRLCGNDSLSSGEETVDGIGRSVFVLQCIGQEGGILSGKGCEDPGELFRKFSSVFNQFK